MKGSNNMNNNPRLDLQIKLITPTSAREVYTLTYQALKLWNPECVPCGPQFGILKSEDWNQPEQYYLIIRVWSSRTDLDKFIEEYLPKSYEAQTTINKNLKEAQFPESKYKLTVTVENMTFYNLEDQQAIVNWLKFAVSYCRGNDFKSDLGTVYVTGEDVPKTEWEVEFTSNWQIEYIISSLRDFLGIMFKFEIKKVK